jgi:hypothetical protein
MNSNLNRHYRHRERIEKKISKFKCNKVLFLIIMVLGPSASNPGDGASEVVLLLSHQRAKKTKKTKT